MWQGLPRSTKGFDYVTLIVVFDLLIENFSCIFGMDFDVLHRCTLNNRFDLVFDLTFENFNIGYIF
jgi:hypothetical protein